jgi:catechol 2,3-dioxygenase-like lactoylglutathione lyase family enzyme
MGLARLAEHSVTHLNLDVADLAASERFYRDELGLPVVRNTTSLRLHSATFLLVLAQGTPHFGGSFHFGFRIASRTDVDAWFARFGERGVTIVEPPALRGAVYVGRVSDPDGYQIEIYSESS